MALLPGTFISAYEIIGPMGAGAMGAVYRARDTRLGREVAVKALPESSALDPERVARFTREAQTLAALNHQHIAAIYGVEESAARDGSPAAQYLILELVEGGTLAERIGRGALPVREALRIGRQVADALEAAHERGIIHRDLKPANIKVSDDGAVKVLDFGLAKALDPQDGAASSAATPTITTPAM